MADVKLSPRARRIVSAGETLAGERWQSSRRGRPAAPSRSRIAMIASGDRPVTDDVERKVAEGIVREADRLRALALKLDGIALKILQSMQK